MNWAGVIIIGIAAFLVISGIQGSWAKFFPWIMSNTSTSSGSQPPYGIQPSNPGHGCPPGQTWSDQLQMCLQIQAN